MVSEKKSGIKKDNKMAIKCCNKIMKTDFCPHCGTPKAKMAEYPQRTLIKFHTNFPPLSVKHGISQEVTIEYEITEKNGDVNLISLSDGLDQFRLVKFGSVDIHGNWL